VNKKDKVDKHTFAIYRQGAQIVVLPDGTLLHVSYRALYDPRGRGGQFVDIQQAIYRSYDQGRHWERLDTPISSVVPTGGFDVEYGIPVRDAGTIPDIAVDSNSGDVYVVWQDGRNSIYGASSVLVSKSSDSGDTWSNPIAVTDISNPGNQSFLPAVAVAADGTVGVLYYDFRYDQFGDAVLTTDVHLVMLDPNLSVLGEARLTDASFDMRQMAIARGYFPGDYVGLDAAGNDFVAAFTVANDLGLPVVPPSNDGLFVDSHNRQDIAFARVSRQAPAPGSRATIPAITSHQSPGAAMANTPLLYPNTPNPFNPTTRIVFEIPRGGAVRLEIFDLAGRRVHTLVNGRSYEAGRHEVVWDGRNRNGVAVPSGVYLYRLRAANQVTARRMVLLK
jgi:hypothetical protein